MKIVQKMKSFCRTGQKAFRVLENRCVRKYDKTSPEKVRLAFRVIMALAAIFTVIFLWAFGESLAILLGLFLLPCLIAFLGGEDFASDDVLTNDNGPDFITNSRKRMEDDPLCYGNESNKLWQYDD
ncbi:hypothetical protein RX799_24690 [Klebsiella oxytoca]|uniref:hypothetical protein n=1 Tax=Klebsiella oxytoca TaxID=571 RepID=UPI00384D22F7